MGVTDAKLVKAFWKEYVDGFIFHDLEAGAQKAEANFLVALGEMCYVDYFGKLMGGRQGSETNFKTFVQKYLPNTSEFWMSCIGRSAVGWCIPIFLIM